MNNRVTATLKAFLVTLLWSSSWLLIRWGLEGLTPLVFASLRYGLATIALWIVAIAKKQLPDVAAIPRRSRLSLAALGIVYYSLTQAAQFVALRHIPATHLTMLLSFSTIAVGLMGGVLLKEWPSWIQWAGAVTYLAAISLFLKPSSLRLNLNLGYLAAAACVAGNAASSLLGRAVNKTKRLSSLDVTLLSMTVGTVVLGPAALAVEGWPSIGVREWVILGWLSIVNTACAFVLWNSALRHLSAMETSVINNAMVFEISLLAVVFLGEKLTGMQWAMIATASAAAFAVQLPRRCPPFRKKSDRAESN